MQITFPCPHCKKKIDAPNQAAGGQLKCPNCHEMLTVPSTSGRSGCVLCGLGITGAPLLCWSLGGGVSGILIGVAGSLAIIATGWWLSDPDKSRKVYGTIWGPRRVFLLLMLVGLCIWVVAFASCTENTNITLPGAGPWKEPSR
jgi:hypothetical protein